ncbi:MAG: DUF47 domain-containing protein [Aggregatilineales bacterium]
MMDILDPVPPPSPPPAPPIAWFDRLRTLFQRKPDRFLARLSEQATLVVTALDMLLDYMKKPSNKNAERVHAVEHEADEVRRILIDELNRTFVTPIDRQDIFALSRAIDDILDYTDTTIIEMEMLSVKPNGYLTQMTSLLHDTAQEIRLAMDRIEKHPALAAEHAAKAKALENQIEGLYREAIADLFRSAKSTDHIVEMLKLREIYQHMSDAADRGDEAANIIGDITVKVSW